MLEVFLDLETTGLNSYKNGVWQIGAIFFKDGEERETFNETCNIYPGQESHPKALEMADLTEERLKALRHPMEVYNEFRALLSKYIDPYNKTEKAFMYGYNVRFDDDFLRQFFYNSGDRFYGSWFWNPAIDVMNLAMIHLKEARPLMTNFKQDSVARALEIEVDDSQLHDALYDIRLTKQIYDKILRLA